MQKTLNSQMATLFAALCLAGTALAQTAVLRERPPPQVDTEAEIMRQATLPFVGVEPGVVRDQRTSLEWMRCSMGQDWSQKYKICEGEPEKYTFSAAQDIARRLNLAGGYNGKTDWRVPTRDELITLVVCTKGRSGNMCNPGSSSPTIAQTVFARGTDEHWYWTSSVFAGNAGFAWYVDFTDGESNDGERTGAGAVRLVRTSK